MAQLVTPAVGPRGGPVKLRRQAFAFTGNQPEEGRGRLLVSLGLQPRHLLPGAEPSDLGRPGRTRDCEVGQAEAGIFRGLSRGGGAKGLLLPRGDIMAESGAARQRKGVTPHAASELEQPRIGT